MKKNKTLQNPVIVVSLCCIAAAAIYFNTIAPLISDRNEEDPGITTPEAAETIFEPTSGEPLQTEEIVALTESSTVLSVNEDTACTRLATVGWRRITSRNPFIDGNVPSVRDTLITPDVPQKLSFRESTNTASMRTVPKTSSIPSPLQAISQGPNGLIALIGSEIVGRGDSCSLGKVTAIDLTTVTVKTNRGTRILRINKSSSGEKQ